MALLELDSVLSCLIFARNSMTVRSVDMFVKLPLVVLDDVASHHHLMVVTVDLFSQC